MSLYRLSVVTSGRTVIPFRASLRATQLRSGGWTAPLVTGTQQRHQSDSLSKPGSLGSTGSSLGAAVRGPDLNPTVTTAASRNGPSEVDLVNQAFKDWQKKKLSEHTQQEVADFLAPRPPSSNIHRDSQHPSEKDPDSILHIDFNALENAPKHFEHQHKEESKLETALSTWKAGIDMTNTSLHLGIKTGRQMEVTRTNPADLGAKLNMLGALVARNSIRQTLVTQRFHERPGLKRKRLKRQRWRKRFAGSFASICKRATSLAAQGW